MEELLEILADRLNVSVALPKEQMNIIINKKNIGVNLSIVCDKYFCCEIWLQKNRDCKVWRECLLYYVLIRAVT